MIGNIRRSLNMLWVVLTMQIRGHRYIESYIRLYPTEDSLEGWQLVCKKGV